jgi:hypothetical protein
MKGAPADVRRRHGDSPKENKSEVIPKKTIMPAAVENPAHFVSTVHRPQCDEKPACGRAHRQACAVIAMGAPHFAGASRLIIGRIQVSALRGRPSVGK